MIQKEKKSLYHKNHISFSITKAHWAYFCRENIFLTLRIKGETFAHKCITVANCILRMLTYFCNSRSLL